MHEKLTERGDVEPRGFVVTRHHDDGFAAHLRARVEIRREAANNRLRRRSLQSRSSSIRSAASTPAILPIPPRVSIVAPLPCPPTLECESWTSRRPPHRPAGPIGPPLRSWSLIVSALYGARLTDQPVVGEETRWATGAREMLTTGDWIVPRQQGVVFPERPPMTMWLMAVVGAIRGDVDIVAIRLPSVIAVVLTSLLIYGYTRALANGFAAFVAALAYASMGQVLQIGRMGESEAVFALLVGASLLLWHLGYMRGWRPIATWSLGFGLRRARCAGEGSASAGLFRRHHGGLPRLSPRLALPHPLAIRGRCRRLRRNHRRLANPVLSGNRLALGDRHLGRPGNRSRVPRRPRRHIVTYPLETFACLLPWSPILVALVKRDTRELLADEWPVVSFLLIALAVAYPTVWIVAGAQARYFMPLYPLIAVLVGLLIERCSVAAMGRYPRRGMAPIPAAHHDAHRRAQPGGDLAREVGFGFVSTPRAPHRAGDRCRGCDRGDLDLLSNEHSALAHHRRRGDRCLRRHRPGGALMNFNIARWNNPVAAVDQIQQIVASAPLVSLTRDRPSISRICTSSRSPSSPGRSMWTTCRPTSNTSASCVTRTTRRSPAKPAAAAAGQRRPARCRSPGKKSPRSASSAASATTRSGCWSWAASINPRQAIVSDATVPQRGINLTAASTSAPVSR